MTKQAITSRAAPSPAGAYSQGIQAGGFVFVAGQAGIDPITGRLVGESIEEQTSQALRNVEAILGSAGLGLGQLVATTAYLADMSLFARYDEAYRRLVPDPLPARATVGAQLQGLLVEISAIAVRD
jgi:reactive intermediate/imine deaminase